MSDASKIAGFRVESTLGHGAGSQIYAVRDGNGQLYALKQVVRRTAKDDRMLEQAIHEHEIANQLNHPVLRHSFRLIRRRRLFRLREVVVLMEHVEGQSLETRRVRSVLEACQIARQVCKGLRHMHQAGFVHADMKPNNILVTPRNEVKIIDFGQGCRSGTVKPRIQGTPDYIAPEQVRQRAITPATDIFNLGATLYWLLTGEHIPSHMPPSGKLKDHKPAKASPPVSYNSAIPPALSGLVMECVREEPRQRPRDMATVFWRLGLAQGQLAKYGSESRQMNEANA